MTILTPTETLSTWLENVRGLEYSDRDGYWVLSVADPRGIGVRVYALDKSVLVQYRQRGESAATPIAKEEQEELWLWLLAEKTIRAKRVMQMTPDVLGGQSTPAGQRPALNNTSPMIPR
jgi:hypothetical protein